MSAREKVVIIVLVVIFLIAAVMILARVIGYKDEGEDDVPEGVLALSETEQEKANRLRAERCYKGGYRDGYDSITYDSSQWSDRAAYERGYMAAVAKRIEDQDWIDRNGSSNT